MALFLVSYDLLNHSTMGDYETLITELGRLGAKRVLVSEWVVQSDDDDTGSAILRDHFLKHVHASDRLLVSEISGDWAGWNLLSTG